MDKEVLKRTMWALFGIYCLMHLSTQTLATLLGWGVLGGVIYVVLKAIKEFEG